MIRKIMFGVVLGFLVALLSVSAVSADQPVFLGPFTFSGTDVIADCGTFQVLDNWTQVITINRFFDKDGNLVRVLSHGSGTDTFTNSVTGKAFTEKYNAIGIRDVDANASINMGVVFQLTVPGEGAVFQSVGRIIFDRATGEVLFEAGHWDFVSGDYSALCAALE
jgi:hypothetical protein